MRTTLLALLVAVSVSWAAAPPAGTRSPRAISVKSVSVTRVLSLYRDLTGETLVVASNVARAPNTITVQTEGELAKDVLAGVLRQALLEQAAVIITPLDEHRASVTYNDRLETK